ncbi:hypothetical protein ACBJ59_12255 [Nonomuraea sp. MTCD27]|uniref:hypothetical protein n=1 Tax=Nonomuraea sp. MTCD27 TaxID=1676747 RepID=UPI0035BFBF9E
MFQQPTAGSNFKAKDHVGHLLLIYVRELRTGIVTQYGPSDAISADVVVLTDQNGPRVEPGVLFFQKPLIGSLRNEVGKDPVLARLGQGVAKPGQDPPYILNPFDQNDADWATQWLTSVGGNPFQTAPALQQPAAPVPQVPQAPVAPLPQAAPAAFPVPAGVGAGVPAPVAAPIPQAPGVPQAPPQWATPQAAPAPIPTAPMANSPEAAAAAAALGMQVPPPAPAVH